MEKSFTTAIKLYIIGKSSGCGSVWLERTAGGREVAGSNPVTPTDLLRRRSSGLPEILADACDFGACFLALPVIAEVYFCFEEDIIYERSMRDQIR